MDEFPPIRPIPAHPPGPTFLTYTPNGQQVISVGRNTTIRVFETYSTDEPTNIDIAQEDHTAVVTTDDFFITGAEDGTVSKYSLKTFTLEEILIRCTLPVRDIALSPDGNWAAVASDELVIKVVNTKDMTRVIHLREQTRPVKHVSFDFSGSLLAASCSDGQVYIYSFGSDEPTLVKKVDGLIKSLETDAEATSKVIWHPDGRAFAAATPTRDIQVVSKDDWENQRVFKSGHTGDITAAAWSPNGALLATSGYDRKLAVWDTKTQRIIKSFGNAPAPIIAMVWHPNDNIFSYTNSDGEVYMLTDFLPPEHAPILSKELQPAPFFHDPLAEPAGYTKRLPINGPKDGRAARRGTPDSLDEILGDDGMSDADGFIEDDDGAGYAEAVNGHGKRGRAINNLGLPSGKRSKGGLEIQTHAAFQPGSTPWRGNRRYLCLNFTGFVWTIDQETHHTVTVEFYDREAHRDFHFTDPFLYDKACLNEKGTLFSCQPSNAHPAMIYYRPHETWTARTDWRTELPPGESITAISLSESFVVVLTSTDYVRIYSLFGVPFRVYRQKSSPTVTCASWKDYVITIGNGPIGGDGTTRLLYTIENVKRDIICQSEDIVALSEGAALQSVFFSDQGDPCIYDSTGTLLVLQHWRTPSQARWVPLLDTKLLSRLASGRKEETYWPVAVANDRFHCIILKGGDKYPYFPRPLLTDFELQIPLYAPKPPSTRRRPASPDAMDEDTHDTGFTETQRLEQDFVRGSVQLSLLDDLAAASRPATELRAARQRAALDVDKALLQLLAAECREGEERGMKALEIAALLRDRSGKMLDAAMKIASRFGRDVLRDKIAEMAERRMIGLESDDEGGGGAATAGADYD